MDERESRIAAAVDAHVADGSVTGAVWGVEVDGERRVGAAGTLEPGGAAAEPDSIFRISSMTKPVTAVAVLQLVDDGVLALDDPIDDVVPELADRQVLMPGATSLGDTVPAERPITLRDVLTFRLGWGMDFSDWTPNPVLAQIMALDLDHAPPAPQPTPPPDEWLRRLGTLPLQRQPGERWLYHLGAELAGVIVARAAGRPFDQVLAERIFEPLGMVDTGFWVPAEARSRFGPCDGRTETGERFVYDPVDGQWATPPAFPGGGAGLVSTVADYLTFARMLLAGGVHDGERILSAEMVREMTTNQLTDEQRTTAGPDPTGTQGWGFGVGVQVQATATSPAGSYGWSGGLGSTWANDPATGTIGVLLTTTMWSSPEPPAVTQAFWSALPER